MTNNDWLNKAIKHTCKAYDEAQKLDCYLGDTPTVEALISATHILVTMSKLKNEPPIIAVPDSGCIIFTWRKSSGVKRIEISYSGEVLYVY